MYVSMTANIILYALIAQAAFVGVILGLFALSYHRLVAKYYSLQKRQQQIRNNAERQASEILDVAQDHAEKIIEEAHVFDEETQALITKHLNAIFEKFSSSLNQKIEMELTNKIQGLDKSIAVELHNLVASMQQQIQTDYAKVGEELLAYKTAQQKKVQENIFEILRSVSQEVLGKVYSEHEHEDLVLEALERAKHEHVL